MSKTAFFIEAFTSPPSPWRSSSGATSSGRSGSRRNSCGSIASNLSFDQMKALVEMLVARIEIYELEEGRKARVLFRFDAKEIATTMPGVEPGLALRKPEKPPKESFSVGNGGSDGQGYYLF